MNARGKQEGLSGFKPASWPQPGRNITSAGAARALGAAALCAVINDRITSCGEPSPMLARGRTVSGGAQYAAVLAAVRRGGGVGEPPHQ